MGGLETSDGGRLRHGLLFRSGKITRDRLPFAKTLLDLREEEGGRTERHSAKVFHFPLDFDEKVKKRLSPILLRKNVEPQILKVYSDAYQEMVAPLAEHLAALVEILSVPEAYPAVIFCKAGKDRTGLTVAVLLLALGVREDLVLDDYLASNREVPRLFERRIRLLNLLTLGFLPVGNLRFLLQCRERYLRAALETIRTEFGSIEAYLQASRIDNKAWARFRAILVDSEGAEDDSKK